MRGPNEKISSREARHFYDMHALLANESPARSFLNDRAGATTELIRDCESVTARWYGGDAPPFAGSLADVSAFAELAIQDRLRSAYEKACGDLCYADAVVPTWDEVGSRVLDTKELLHVN